jgi:hypothetical protein
MVWPTIRRMLVPVKGVVKPCRCRGRASCALPSFSGKGVGNTIGCGELNDWFAAATIDRGKLFSRVNKVGRAWGDEVMVKGGLAHREGIRQKHRSGEVAPHDLRWTSARLCPRIGRRVGADPISFGQVPVHPGAGCAVAELSSISRATTRHIEHCPCVECAGR